MVKREKTIALILSMALLFTVLTGMPVQAATKPVVQAIPKVQFVKAPVTEYTEGDRVQFDIYAPNYGGKVEYRVVLWNNSTKSYGDLWDSSNGYPTRYYTKWQPGGKSTFTLGWPIFEPGTYRITVYAKRVGVPASKAALKGMNCDSYIESVAFTVKPKVALESTLILDKQGTTYKPTDGATPEKVSGDVKVVGDNITYENSNVEGNLYISANNATLNNITVKETIFLDPGKDGNAYLNNVSAKNIKVLSGGQNSIHFKNVDSENLLVDSSSNVRVETTGSTKIGNTKVTSYAILDSKGGTLGTVVVSKNESGKFEVELRGTFSEPIVVETEATIKAAENTSISKLDIQPQNGETVKLEGNFNNVEVNKAAKVELGANTVVDKIVSNAATEINASKTSKVNKVEGKNDEVKVSGEGAGNVNKPSTPPPAPPVNNNDNGSGSDNRIRVTGVTLNAASVELVAGQSITLVANVTPSNASNKNVTWRSSEPEIASVDDNGRVRAKKEGTAVITVTTQDRSYSASATVTVRASGLESEVEVVQGGLKFNIDSEISNDVVTIKIVDSNNNIKYFEQQGLINGKVNFTIPLDAGEYKVYIKMIYLDSPIEISVRI